MKTEQIITDFNRRVQRLQMVTGQSQTEIARALDVSRTTLHYYSQGQNTPKPAALFRLEQAEREAGITGDTRLLNDRPQLGEGGVRTAGELARHLGWLRAARGRQEAATLESQRHLRELDEWIADTEAELTRLRDTGLAEGSTARYSPEQPPLIGVRQESPVSRPAPRKEKRACLRDIDTVSIPLFGALPAGFPQTRDGVMAQRPDRRLKVARGRFPEGAFGLEVRGDSMNAARPDPILDHDIVVLLSPEQREPQPGDVVAALIDGETCLKRLRSRQGKAFLKSESTNPAHGEIHPNHDLVIQGVVVGKLGGE